MGRVDNGPGVATQAGVGIVPGLAPQGSRSMDGRAIENKSPEIKEMIAGLAVTISGPGATRTRDLLLRSRPTPATASARWRRSLRNQRPVACGRQPAPGRWLLGTLLAAMAAQATGIQTGAMPVSRPAA